MKKARKVHIIPKKLDLGAPELNSTIQSLDYVGLDISSLLLFIVHNVLNGAKKQPKDREHIVYEQLKQSKTKVTNLEAESIVVAEQKEQV